MAQRRMFSKDITGADAFLEMPISSQLLYFQLGMEADDDGFVGSPKKISRMIGAGDDDLKILLAKRFLLSFESGVVVIKHWKINNYIQSDRYKETRYTDEKKLLDTKSNGSYTECIQSSNKLDTQVRLGKVSKGKSKSSIPCKSVDLLPVKNEVQKILDMFYEFNPGLNFGNITQRVAVEWLLNKMGEEKLIGTINYYKSIMAERYSPKITTPLEMKNKLGDLLNFYNKSLSPTKGGITILK